MRGDGRDRGGGAGDDDLTGPAGHDDAGNAADVDATLRIANQVKQDFDRIGVVRACDEALIARLADRALASRAPVRRRRADRRLAAALGLGLALFASAATAWWAVRTVTRWSEGRAPADRAPDRRARVGSHASMPADAPPPAAPAPSVALSSPPGPAARAAANRALAPGRAGSAVVSAGSTRPTPGGDVVHSMPAPRPSDRGPALAPPPALVSDQVAAPTAGRAGLAPPSTVPSLRPAPPADTTIGAGSAMAPPAWSAPVAATAGDLFQRANSARRAGDVGLARALYRQVEDRFPGSAEARLARVSLGKLLLAAGDARGAEDEFAHYLAGGSGPLVQEALVGRAESLQSLARPDEERRVWQRIVDEFPAGVYAAQARRRLTELGAPRRGPAR